VESPAKARTIAGFLGAGFTVESSIGHIRDLPRNAADVPASLKKEAWARLGVDVEHDFKPLYVVDQEKKSHLAKLKGLLDKADRLFLATDEDREGESIAWHLFEVLKPRVPVKRMVFHEITKKAIDEAIRQPREIDRRLVDAQEARRILDRLYGYEVSPVLWKKVMPKLSAGRVQSVAVRIVVQRERERIAFVPAGYWDVEGTFTVDGRTPPQFTASLNAYDGQRVATGKDFGSDGKTSKADVRVVDEALAKRLADSLPKAKISVASVERKPSRRSPSPPFMTSTLQQEAARKLRFSASRTMRAAQRLYESGYITYMRTDSTTLSDGAIASARAQIERMYGKEFVPPQPRVYKNKVKNAQEAHEAIRPAGDVFRMPDQVNGEVGGDEARLYELIWMRTIASQMKDSEGESVSVRLAAKLPDGKSAEFAVSGHTITFPGFLRAYVEGSDDPSAELEERERQLPPVKVGEVLRGEAFVPKGHETQPPARYTEASLVRRLEELGVGRPSTYASILSTILDRGYVWRKGTALVPSWTAFAVIGLLEKHFGDLVDFAFTARMEDDLDAIASGSQEAVPWLKEFYFGEQKKGGTPGLRTLVGDQLEHIDARAINSLPIGKDEDGNDVVVRVGRYGAYVQRGEETASLPPEMAPDEVNVASALELLQRPSGDRVLGVDPESGETIVVKNGRFGAYVQAGEGGGKEKPKTSSLLRSMSPESVTLEDALKLLSLPRTVGVDPADGVAVTSQIGRYGPYVAKGTDSRSLEAEEQVFSVTLEQALALFAQPRTRKARAAATPLREIGVDGVSNKPITLREGRFGLYVTDGETNASLRKGDSPEELTLERAQELLQERRERAPTQKPKKGKGRAAADKGAKKAAADASEEPPAAKRAGASKGVKKAATKASAAEPKTKSKAPPSKTAAKANASKAPAKKAATSKSAKAGGKSAGKGKTPSGKAASKSGKGRAASDSISP
jgi:DNA topoisomerase-1